MWIPLQYFVVSLVESLGDMSRPQDRGGGKRYRINRRARGESSEAAASGQGSGRGLLR